MAREGRIMNQLREARRKKDLMSPRDQCLCSSFHFDCCTTIKPTNPGISIDDVAPMIGDMLNGSSDRRKQLCITQVVQLKRCGKEASDHSSKESLMAQTSHRSSQKKSEEEEKKAARGRIKKKK